MIGRWDDVRSATVTSATRMKVGDSGKTGRPDSLTTNRITGRTLRLALHPRRDVQLDFEMTQQDKLPKLRSGRP